ncbi:hypothetical protein L596_019083 [Steinernema carpocapsae]|nr:hypothetical protein L596_019083 [Steinernema carpocapsae]
MRLLAFVFAVFLSVEAANVMSTSTTKKVLTKSSTTLTPKTISTTLAPVITTKDPFATEDRECACTYSKIWLDIVLVIDVSKSMSEGLSSVAADLFSMFGQMEVSQKNGQYSRVALVSAGENATTVSDLNTYQNIDDLNQDLVALQVGKDKDVNVQAGLNAASEILKTTGNQRARKQVILLYTSAYNQGGYKDPLETATQLKDSGVSIITAAYVKADESTDVLKIGELATPSLNFTNIDSTGVVAEIMNSYCQVNCFCRSNWAQFADKYNSLGAHRFGVCLKFIGMPASWYAANAIGCRNKGSGAYLATEFSAKKHTFNKAYYADMNRQIGNRNYHIGLRKNHPSDTSYVWVQGTSKDLKLDPNGYKKWAPGMPNISIGECVSVKKTGFLSMWANTNCYTDIQNYLCESVSCDTDNFCDMSQDTF